VEALNFMTAMYGLNHPIIQQIDNAHVIVSLTNWFETFVCHTIALDAVCRFMEIVLKITNLSELVIRQFMPVVVKSDKKPGNRIQIAFAIRWAREVWSAAQAREIAVDLARETEFVEFCLSTVSEADRILKERYGTDVKDVGILG
jgi:hypothetical protein